ncbi:autotransporter outer membrane beta-barrel domain-containing protein [Bradyrhizobium sp. Y36]|uniref:autotransporter outer membrane beta-barrel domain-containing protein n=1 Tax=Bradyrhizobium sp. Y36 TaxID=2035447 RepID=UPI001FE149CF|nr:autotransporter outer membrane beta-barrel domain-containing protein [Bradyrhizobium sp. Y36]
MTTLASGAQAQTCVGTADIVCTYTGASGIIGDPPSGPVSGSTSLTNILKDTGTATSIRTVSGEFGDATSTNFGVVGGSVSASAGIFFGNSFTGTATVTNYGTVGGNLVAHTDFAADAIVYNYGDARNITASVNATPYGSARIYNYGRTNNISIQVANSSFGEALIVNAGTANFIYAHMFGSKSTVINSGYADSIVTDALQGGYAKTVNSGTVKTNILTTSSNSFFQGSAETINSGSVRDITTTASTPTGSATTTNEATGVARNIQTTTDGTGTAITINYGNAASLSSSTNAGSAAVWNAGTVNGPVAANADTGPASVTNSGTIRGVATVVSAYNGSTGPGSFLTNSGLIDGTGYYAAIDVTSNASTNDRMTINLLQGSHVIGQIWLAGDASDPNRVGTTINIQGGRGNSSILTFGDSNGSSGLIDTASHVNVSGVPYVVSGNSVATVDPSSFGVASRNVVDVTHAIAGLASGRLANDAPASSEGPAIGFAPSGNVARDMFNEAFAAMPGMAYAGQDRVLSGNPNFTATDGTSVWAQGFGGRRIAPEDGMMLRSINSFYGGAIGADKIVQPRLRLGVLVGGGNLQSSLAADAGRTTSDLGFAGIYGRYALSGGFLDFSLLGGGSGNTATRRVDNNLVAGGVEYARAGYAGWFVSPELAYGFDLAIAANLTLTPSMRVRYLAAGFGGYQESGSAANLDVGSRLSHYFEERGGVTLTRSFAGVGQGTLKVSGSAGVVGLQRAGDADVNAVLLGQNLAFAAPGGGNVVGYFAGAGLDWRHASGVSLFAATEYNEMSDASRTVTGRGGIKIGF